MKVAVLAVQGAFIEHEKMMNRLEVDCIELRKKSDLVQNYDGIILPGGESTVQGKLIKELDMFDTLKKQIEDGMPTMATCAGLILLAENVANDDRSNFKTLSVTVKRNAYGRQLGSFYAEEQFGDLGKVPMTYIRAPYIESVENGVEVLAKVDGNIVAVRYKNQLAMAFHPELNDNLKIHSMFIDIIKNN